MANSRVMIAIKIRMANFYQSLRQIKYGFFSTSSVVGTARLNQPALFAGKGKVILGKNVNIGHIYSPAFFSNYAHIEARNSNSIIELGDDVWLNNGASIISAGEGIYIGERTICGTNLQIIDSDFHNLDPAKRMEGSFLSSKVIVKENVFIGSNVTILKGVIIGENSVIASGSVVTKNIPANVIAGGNPAKILKQLTVDNI